MMRFELCFPTRRVTRVHCAGVAVWRAAEFDWDLNDNLRFEYHYGFMPAGMMTRFIARNYTSIEGERYWKNARCCRGRERERW